MIYVKSDTGIVAAISGIHISFNDFLYERKITNRILVEKTGLDGGMIAHLRSGRMKLTKDILYVFGFFMRFSSDEFEAFLKQIGVELDFHEERDRLLLKEMNHCAGLAGTFGKSVLEYVNCFLENQGEQTLGLPEAPLKENPAKRTILITGGFGFIGRNCIDYLKNTANSEKRYELCVLTRKVPEENNFPKNVVCYAGEMDDSLLFERIMLENRVDYIVHLAGASTRSEGEKDIGDTAYDNGRFIDIICDTLKKNHLTVKGLIFPSTALVYEGAENEGLCSENLRINPENIKNKYVKSKYFAELKAGKFTGKEIPIIIARISNVYGIYETKQNRLVPRVIDMLEKGQVPEVYVDRESKKCESKDYIYSEDLAEAIGLMIQRLEQPDFLYDDNHVFNIGSGKVYSVNEIVDTIIEIMGKDMKPKLIEKDLVSGMNTLCVEKAEQEFGFTAKTRLYDGLVKTVQWSRRKRGDMR